MSAFDTPQDEIAWLRERLDQTRAEKDEALALVDEVRESLSEYRDIQESWKDVFDMTPDDRGVWMFDNQADLFSKYDKLLTDYNKLIRDWNKFVPRYNATINPKDAGRPLAASEAQVANVKKHRKAGLSLRATAKETGLSLRTVRTILDNDEGKGRTAERKGELRRLEFGRLRAAAFRAKKRNFDALPKQIAQWEKSADLLEKAARGLAKS